MVVQEVRWEKGGMVRAGNFIFLYGKTGTAVPHWLRRCATSRKVAGSIPDGVIRIFN